MESSSEDSDCTNPHNDYIYKPRRSSRIAKRLKGDSKSEDNATSTCAMYTSPKKTRRKPLASTSKALRNQAAPKKKTKKAIILDMLRGLDTEELQNEIEAHVAEQIRSSNRKCNEMTAILNSFTEDIHLLKEAIDCHCDIFIKLYAETSTGKERYLQFQIEWHAKCSLFLLPKHIPTDENASKAASAFPEGCSRFKKTSTHSVDDCDRIMILFSALYNILLNKIHSQSIKSSVQVQTEDIVNADGDDVYFCFGGAVISDMLHLRYKQIRTCSDSEKKSSISEQISIV
uniref:Uncharacterized protein n=1 Tax=Amphimedon queenslandica TaxID=400682 RepID=A0A1X7UAR4_AMPQE